MAAITFGLSGLTFGVTAETGVVVMSVKRNALSGSKEVMNEQGDIIAHGAYGFKADYSVGFHYINTVTGIGAANVGNTYSLANGLNQNGVSGGHYIVKSFDLDFSQDDFMKGSVTLTQYPSI